MRSRTRRRRRARATRTRLSALLRHLRGRDERDGEGGRRQDIERHRACASTTPSCARRYDRAEPRLADLDQLRVIAAGYPVARRVPRRPRARAAVQHAGPRRRHRVGDRRARPQHRAQRQGQGVGRRVRHLGGRRLVPVVALDRGRGGARGGATAHVRRDDAREDHLAVTYPLQRLRQHGRGADYSIDQLSRFLDRGVRATMQRVVVGGAGRRPRARAPLTQPVGRSPGAAAGAVHEVAVIRRRDVSAASRCHPAASRSEPLSSRTSTASLSSRIARSDVGISSPRQQNRRKRRRGRNGRIL